jgi:hypothetical protein
MSNQEGENNPNWKGGITRNWNKYLKNYRKTPKFKAKRKEYCEKTKDKAKKYHKERYEKNKKDILKNQREYYLKNKEIVKNSSKKRYLKNKDKIRKRGKKWYELNYFKEIVKRIAQRKIKIPKNQVCERCNEMLAVDRHHKNYKKPLEVKFLCRSCHLKIHRGKL